MKERYLVVYDYGMGGVWAYVLAPSPTEIAERFPELTVVESKPDWMSREGAGSEDLPVEDIDEPGDFLASILAERGSS